MTFAHIANKVELNVQKNMKNTHQVRTQYHYPVEVPVIVNMDDYAVATDDELSLRLRELERDHQEVIDAHLDPKFWEEELAYARRELQIRRDRREAHAKYVRDVEREFNETEANLPMADTDNSKFLRFIGEIN